MRTNIHAFTESRADYPAYVSINREESGVVTLTVRSRGNGGNSIGTIVLSPEQIEVMANDLIDYVHREG